RAVAYEHPSNRASLTDLFQKTAQQFVREAQARAGGEPFNLDHIEALRGIVLATAEEQLGSREDAFRLLGKEALLVSRNHHKTFRREIERVEALYRVLGEDDRFPFRRPKE
ncbi:MAG: sigma-54-dependent Fis family transcriptional regulator, partial [Polyangiaceae bacterium]